MSNAQSNARSLGLLRFLPNGVNRKQVQVEMASVNFSLDYHWEMP